MGDRETLYDQSADKQTKVRHQPSLSTLIGFFVPARINPQEDEPRLDSVTEKDGGNRWRDSIGGPETPKTFRTMLL
jgi:hypothetical protein